MTCASACRSRATGWPSVWILDRTGWPRSAGTGPTRRRPSTRSSGSSSGAGVRRFVLSHGGASPDLARMAELVRTYDVDFLVAGGVRDLDGIGRLARYRRERPDPRRGPARRRHRLQDRTGDRRVITIPSRRLAAPLLALTVAVRRCRLHGRRRRAPRAPAPAAASAEATAECPTSQPEPLPAGETRTVTLDTALGAIAIEVEADLSPIAAGNFVALASCGYYDGTPFHRTPTLQDGTPFVIQGGDPTGTGTGGPGYRSRTSRSRPSTSAAPSPWPGPAPRTRSAPSSSSSSMTAPAPILASANTYQIIGNVSSGMETADAIYEASRGRRTARRAGRHHHRHRHQPVAQVQTSSPHGGHAHDPSHHRHRDRRHRDRAVRRERPEGRRQLRRRSPARATTTTSSSIASSRASSSRAATGSTARSRTCRRAASARAVPATSSRTRRSRATTCAARSRWPTPARTRTAASSSSATRT